MASDPKSHGSCTTGTTVALWTTCTRPSPSLGSRWRSSTGESCRAGTSIKVADLPDNLQAADTSSPFSFAGWNDARWKRWRSTSPRRSRPSPPAASTQSAEVGPVALDILVSTPADQSECFLDCTGYRRGKPTSADCDLVFTHPTGGANRVSRNVLDRLVEEMTRVGQSNLLATSPAVEGTDIDPWSCPLPQAWSRPWSLARISATEADAQRP